MFVTVDSERGILTSKKVRFEEVLALLADGALTLMSAMDKQFASNCDDPDEQDAFHGKLYDTFNLLAGNVLDLFDGDRSPTTDLTAQAILEAENAILDREVPNEAEESVDDKVEENPA